MSEQSQIEAMAKVMCKYYGTEKCYDCPRCCNCCIKYEAEKLYSEGFRKQIEGEWQIKSEIYKLIDDVDEELYVECPFCKRRFPVPYEFDDEKIFKYAREHYPYCNCGAKMKGEGKANHAV